MNRKIILTLLIIFVFVTILATVFFIRFNPNECSSGQIMNRGICKPAIIDLDLQYSNPKKYIHYLGYGEGKIYDKKLFDYNYAPLVNKAKQLIAGKTTTYDKVKAIANYVYNSKIYANDFNPLVDSIQSYWEMDRGKCFHAAQLTTAMLNVVGIPALHHDVYSMSHAQTLVNIDGVWGVIDTTFHKSSLSDPDVEINLPSLETMRKNQLFITGDYMGMYSSTSGKYCNYDNSICLSEQFRTLRVMANPAYQRQTLFVPLTNRFFIIDNNYIEPTKYYGCELVLPYGCSGGCTNNPVKPVYNDARIGYIDYYYYSVSGNSYPPFEFRGMSAFDNNNNNNGREFIHQLIGYIKLTLPKNNLPYKYTCYRLDPSAWSSNPHVDMHPVAVYNFSMDSSSQIKIMWNNLQKSSQSTQEEFNDVINYIKSTTQDLGISI